VGFRPGGASCNPASDGCHRCKRALLLDVERLVALGEGPAADRRAAFSCTSALETSRITTNPSSSIALMASSRLSTRIRSKKSGLRGSQFHSGAGLMRALWSPSGS
jgi:hypothetical protein